MHLMLRRLAGRAFHKVGAATLKDLSPNDIERYCGKETTIYTPSNTQCSNVLSAYEANWKFSDRAINAKS